MNTFRIALTELRRITAGRLPKLALAALVLVPTLYGGLYLYANHDPYARLNQVPAALVMDDAGTTQTDGTRLRAGADVADELLRKNNFDWHRVTAQQAATGVKGGTYDFALTIPAGFSASLASSGRYDPRQARLEMTTNDANSYLSTTIADKVTAAVRDAIAQKVGVQAATQFLLGLGDVRGGLIKARNGATELTNGLTKAQDGARKLRDGSGKLATGSGQLATGSTTLATGLETLRSSTANLPSQTRALASGARQVANGNAQVAAIGDRIATASRQVQQAVTARRADLSQAMDDQGLTAQQKQRLLGIYDRLATPARDANTKVQAAATQLNRLSAGANQVADGNQKLASATPALVNGITQARDGSRKLATGASQLRTGAGQLRTGAADLATGEGKLRTGGQQLTTGLADGVKKIPALDSETRKRLADTIADPVAVASTSQATASSYGAGLAPFFLSLAAWIGAYVLFMLIRPLSTRAMAANQNPLRVALGGWLTPALVGLAQVSVLLVVVSVGVGIVPVNSLGSWAFLALVSATFVAILHALSAWFGKTGQFLGLVLMVTQLITAGGTFPWQTIPQPLYVFHHLLPMSYAVDGLRQLMYGGLDSRVWGDCLALALWLVLGVLASTRAARRQRVWTVKRIKPELSL